MQIAIAIVGMIYQNYMHDIYAKFTTKLTIKKLDFSKVTNSHASIHSMI